MNSQIAEALIPAGWPHSVSKAVDKKRICEDVLQEIINQIENENRNPTKWELNGLSEAVKNIRFGAYALAMGNAMSAFTQQQDVAQQGDLWSPVADDLALEKLNRDLARLKGEPPRIDN